MWHLRIGWSKCCLLILLVLGAVSVSSAQTDNLLDPLPQPGSNSFNGVFGGPVDIFPGGNAHTVVFQVLQGQSISFLADVIPNIGHPLPKIHIWYSPDDPSLTDATIIFSTRQTGPSVLNPPQNTYRQSGYYQAVFKYPAGQAQGPPGDAFDFIFVNLQVQVN
jgi:hypothetical protein